MKRLFAGLIDYLLIFTPVELITAVLYIKTASSWTALLFQTIAAFICLFLTDLLFKGSSVGKRLLRAEPVLKEQSLLRFAVLHSLYKLLFICLLPIGLLVYLGKGGEMPYDRDFYQISREGKPMGVSLKRLAAFGIDYLLLIFILIPSVTAYASFMSPTALPHQILPWTALLIYAYFFLQDLLFRGSSIGKKAVGLRVVLKDRSLLRFAALHGLLKMIFSCVYIITLPVYLIRNGMPYDAYFYQSIQ